jgi:hypothetical protein
MCGWDLAEMRASLPDVEFRVGDVLQADPGLLLQAGDARCEPSPSLPLFLSPLSPSLCPALSLFLSLSLSLSLSLFFPSSLSLSLFLSLPHPLFLSLPPSRPPSLPPSLPPVLTSLSRLSSRPSHACPHVPLTRVLTSLSHLSSLPAPAGRRRAMRGWWAVGTGGGMLGCGDGWGDGGLWGRVGGCEAVGAGGGRLWGKEVGESAGGGGGKGGGGGEEGATARVSFSAKPRNEMPCA